MRIARCPVRQATMIRNSYIHIASPFVFLLASMGSPLLAQQGAARGGLAASNQELLRQLSDSDPKTLDQLTRAIRISMQLGDLAEFNRYAESWLVLTPSDADLAALDRKYGSALFLELARRRELQPAGGRVATTVLSGAAKFVRDPVRLSGLITKLSEKEEATQLASLRGLREAGRYGTIALVHALADESFMPDRPAIRQALVKLGRDSIDPLIAALSAPQPSVRADAAKVLGTLKARAAAPYLVGLAASAEDTPDRAAAREALQNFVSGTPGANQASQFIATRIRQLLAGELPAAPNEQDEIQLWRWDDAANSVRLDSFPREQAALVVAARYARQLPGITKAASLDPAIQQLALLVQLEADQTFAGLDQPLPRGAGTAWSLAKAWGDDVLEDTLALALELDRPTAIAATLEVLGDSGRPELLSKYAGREGPLMKALGYPDRRVQVAALKAILALDPATAYPGSSRVVETMKFLLSSEGQPRVLVAHPISTEALRIATLYSELGYEAESATSGSTLVRKAIANSDYELILVSESLADLSDAVQALRKDPRTARVPVGVMSQYVIREPRYLPEPLPEEGRLEFLRSVFSLNSNRDEAVEAYQIAVQASRDSRLTLQDLSAGVPTLLASATKLGLKTEDLMAISVKTADELGKLTFPALGDLLTGMVADERFHQRGLLAFKDLAALNDAERARVLGGNQNRKLAYAAVSDAMAEIETVSARYKALSANAKAERWKIQIDDYEFEGLTEITAAEIEKRKRDEERFSAKRLPGQRAENLVDKVPLATVVPTPFSPEALNYTHHQVMKLAPTRAVAAVLRLEQAHYVLEQLTGLLSLDSPPNFYDYSRLEPTVVLATRSPVLAQQAFEVLALLGTPKAQLALVEQANISAAPLEERKAAANALHRAILRHGLYLTQAQIEQQYNLFEQSGDAATRTILRDVLDAIEEPTAAARAEKQKLLPDRNENKPEENSSR